MQHNKLEDFFKDIGNFTLDTAKENLAFRFETNKQNNTLGLGVHKSYHLQSLMNFIIICRRSFSLELKKGTAVYRFNIHTLSTVRSLCLVLKVIKLRIL